MKPLGDPLTPPRKHGIRPHMKEPDILHVLSLLDAWGRGEILERLSLATLGKASGWQRQTLAKQGEIAHRYKEVKAGLRARAMVSTGKHSRRDASPSPTLSRLRTLEAELRSLEATLSEYDLLIRTIRHNAKAHGLSDEQLLKRLED